MPRWCGWGCPTRRDAVDGPAEAATACAAGMIGRMSELGREMFGQPCRECGFSWDIEVADAMVIVAGVHERLSPMLADASGTERHHDLEWSVTAYVCHVTDNLRIWAERLAGVALGGSPAVTGCDEAVLGEVRGYETISLPGALWSLDRAARDWLDAVAMAPADLTMDHSGFGRLALLDVVRLTAHDTHHHVWDIDRTLPR